MNAAATDASEQIRRLRAGDERAVEPLARHACRLALRTAAVLVGDRDAAAEVAQEVAIEVIRSLGKLREPRAFEAWCTG